MTTRRSLRERVYVASVERALLEPFLREWHYAGGSFGVTHELVLGVYLDGALVGGGIFGPPAAYNVTQKYSEGGKYRVTELRRFVLQDDTPRNTESCALGKMVPVLKLAGFGLILAYADPAQGHGGVIYKAAGYTFRGRTSARKHYIWKGKKYPDRNIHQTNFPYHEELRKAIKDGSAVPVKVPGKLIFTKEI